MKPSEAQASHKELETFCDTFHTMYHPLSEDEYREVWSQLRPLLVRARRRSPPRCFADVSSS